MIRERGFPLGCVVLIWIDYPEGKKEKNDFSGMVKMQRPYQLRWQKKNVSI